LENLNGIPGTAKFPQRSRRFVDARAKGKELQRSRDNESGEANSLS
jgi:hypothetical protein